MLCEHEPHKTENYAPYFVIDRKDHLPRLSDYFGMNKCAPKIPKTHFSEKAIALGFQGAHFGNHWYIAIGIRY